MEITRHFTATTFVVYNKKVLLHPHKKLGIWLPPGGHLDRDELPEEAALREVREEAGLEVTLYQNLKLPTFSDAQVLIEPYCTLLENINPYHQHIDFIFFASALTDQLNPGLNEVKNMQWLSLEELKNINAPENVKVLAKEAIKLI